MPIDKDNTKVIMSLADYETLQSYERAYKMLVNNVKGLAYIDGITNDSATIVIDKGQVEQFIYPYTEKDCELSGYEDSLIFEWK